MKLPQKVTVKTSDSAEIKEIKQTLNALLDFHYNVHNTTPNKHFKPHYFKRNKKELSPKSKAIKDAMFKQDKGKQFSMVGSTEQTGGGGGC